MRGRGRGDRNRRPGLRSAVVIAGLALAGLVAAAPASAIEVTVRDIHVTQGMQTVRWEPGNPLGMPVQEGNTIPLVAGRSTAVRVLLDVQLEPGEAMPTDVRGRMLMSVDGQPLSPIDIPAGGLPAINEPFTPPVGPTMVREEDTLNFELRSPSSLQRGGAGTAEEPFRSGDSNDVRVTVLITSDSLGVLGGASVQGLRLVSLAAPVVYFLPVTYTPFSNNPPDAAVYATGSPIVGPGNAMIYGALPIPDDCPMRTCPYVPFGSLPTAFSEGLDYSIEFGEDSNGSGRLEYDLDDDPDVVDAREPNALLDELEQRLALRVDADDPAGPRTFLHAWVRSGSLVDHGGAARPGQNVSYGNDAANHGQLAIAHELTHLHGLVEGTPSLHNEPDRSLAPNLGWDVGGRLIDNPATNGVTGRLKGLGLRDLMNNEGVTTSEGWLDATTYQELIDRQPRGRGAVLAAAAGAGAGARAAGRARCGRSLTIFGEVTRFRNVRTRTGTRLEPRAARLRKSFSYPPCRVPQVARRGDAQLLAEVITRVGRRTLRSRHPVDARTIINRHLPGMREHDHDVLLGPFTVTVPLRGELVSVRLLDRSGRTTLDREVRSRPPAVSLRGVKAGSRLPRRLRLRWTIRDRDTRAGHRANVSWSPDGGRSFLPVDVNLSGRSLRVDTSDLPPSKGDGVLRLLVSDGLNTRRVDVRRLTLRR